MFQGGLFFIGFTLSILLAVFSFFAFWKGRLGIKSFMLWILLSIGLAVLSTFPGLIDTLAHLFFVQVRSLFVLTIGLLVVYVLIYAGYVSQRNTEKTVQRLSQEISLLRYRLEYKIEGIDHADSSDYSSTE